MMRFRFDVEPDTRGSSSLRVVPALGFLSCCESLLRIVCSRRSTATAHKTERGTPDSACM